MWGSNWSLFLRHLYIAFTRPHMSLPPLINGIFTKNSVVGPLDPNSWESLLSSDELTAQCYIERVVFCKCSGGKEHEFLKVFVRHALCDRMALLVVDRSIDTSDQVINSSRASTISFSDNLASDRILIARLGDTGEKIVTAHHEPYRELGTLTFQVPINTASAASVSGVAPSARDLCVLLQVVNKHAPAYTIRHHQCYWLANIVFEALKHIFPPASEIAESHYRGKRQHSRRGELKGVLVASVSQDDKTTIVDEYKRSVKEAAGWGGVQRENNGVREEHYLARIELLQGALRANGIAVPV